MDLDVQLMPMLVPGSGIKSQFPGGTGTANSIYAKIAPERKAMAYTLMDYLSTDANDTYLIQDAAQTLGTNIRAQGSSDPVAVKEKALLPNMTIYLDWYWPPEITRAFQEGIQAGVSGNLTAQAVAKDIQSVFDGLVANGYKFKI
jgi:hypothetical protein